MAGLALLVVIVIPTRAVGQEGDDRPSVLLIVTDDQRWDTLGAMPEVQSRLIDRGVSFSNAFVVNPVCCPSRVSILTGNYSHTTLVYRQAPPFGRLEWFRDRSSLATWLDHAGYATGLFGKYLDGYQHAALTGSVPPGWDRWVAFVHAAYYDYRLTVDGRVRDHGSDPADYSTDVLAGEAVRFIEATEGPVFVEFAPAAPHAPATAAPGDIGAFDHLEPARPPSFDEPDVADKPTWVRELPPLGPETSDVDAFRAAQYASLLGVDRAVGRLLDALEATGRLENTLVVLTSDNGIHHGEHRWTKKETAYEESIRVPLVVRWDAARWASGSRPDALALNIDIAPTIADAARVPFPRTDGRSLLGVLAGEPDVRRDFLVEHLENQNPVPTFCAVRSRTAKYVRYAGGEEELYDLRSDPFELRNAVEDPESGALLEALRARLDSLCRPAPPGLDASTSGRLELAILAIGVLVLVEALAGRRASVRTTRAGTLSR